MTQPVDLCGDALDMPQHFGIDAVKFPLHIDAKLGEGSDYLVMLPFDVWDARRCVRE